MKFLFAWELGGGLGHMVRLAQIARPLLAAGHHVDFALRELSSARTGLADLYDHPRVRLWQAPIWQLTFKAGRHPVSYAEVLFAVGYLDAKRLAGLARGWRSLIASIAPDLLLADHSPTALLAARGFACPRVAIGSGFFVPPPVAPIPPFAEWERIDPARVVDTERVALQTCNAVLVELGLEPMSALHQLFSEAESFLFSGPELDHYRPATRGPTPPYRGVLPSPPGGVAPRWPDGDGRRLFAYLKVEYDQTVAILRQLASGPWRTFAYVSSMMPADAAALSSPYLNVSTTVADIDAVGESADALLCHGGFNTVNQLLEAGVPTIVLPTQSEQVVVGRRLEEAGLGIVLQGNRVLQDLPAALRRLATEASFKDAALSFADRHAVGGDEVVRRAAARCEALASAYAAAPHEAA